MTKTLLFIPPLTQLNTPYPATAYLTGFLRQQGLESRQGDLGLDLVLSMFNANCLTQIFDEIEKGNFSLSPELKGVLINRNLYQNTIDAVISFLQNKNYTLGYRIAKGNFLPQGSRFNQVQDLEWFFGNIGVQDTARYKCTMYLEDLSDLIQASIGPQFGFSKYAERIARTAVSFDPIEAELKKETGFLDQILIDCAKKYFDEEVPDFVGFTVPFGGNLYGALKVGQWIKENYPNVKIAMGGGYPNTELRELTDPRVFQYVDYITLDDGEGPLLNLIQNIQTPDTDKKFKRTFHLAENKVVFTDNLQGGDFLHQQKPAPSYRGLKLDQYLSVIDMPNPMHRLWNDGRWNKMTVAHGCYWKKCSFCDIHLDYIGRYDKATAEHLVNQMEELIAETGETGFHFVDEAAPPAALRDLAIEIINRKLQVSWWTNIRFEKSFDADLCQLLAASGCIAVTGGLEVASPRILALIDKGITVDQVARVGKAFSDAGILVHAYLMYGFPTQTAQETIDSLEVVRQLFQHNLLHSGHWHQFAMTVHSPVGKDPEKYGVIRTGPEFQGFANNDLYHEDPKGAQHELFSGGLKKALYNYMHGIGIDFPLKKFFSFAIPDTLVPRTMIERSLKFDWIEDLKKQSYLIIPVSRNPQISHISRSEIQISVSTNSTTYQVILPSKIFNVVKRYLFIADGNSSGEKPLLELIQALSQNLEKSEDALVASSLWNKLRPLFWLKKQNQFKPRL